jgi:hypothetical protein
MGTELLSEPPTRSVSPCPFLLRRLSPLDEGYVEAVTHDRNDIMAAQRGNCVAPKAA